MGGEGQDKGQSSFFTNKHSYHDISQVSGPKDKALLQTSIPSLLILPAVSTESGYLSYPIDTLSIFGSATVICFSTLTAQPGSGASWDPSHRLVQTSHILHNKQHPT